MFERVSAGDELVCAYCQEAESGSPYTLDNIPDDAEIPRVPLRKVILEHIEDKQTEALVQQLEPYLKTEYSNVARESIQKCQPGQ